MVLAFRLPHHMEAPGNSIPCVCRGRLYHLIPTLFDITCYHINKGKNPQTPSPYWTRVHWLDNMNNYCFFVHADIPVLLFVYSHFTKYELFIHTKLIIVFLCHHITCCALIYSHFTSPQKVKKKCIPARHQTSLIFCWVFFFCRFPIFKTVLWHVTKWKFTNLFTVTK